MHAWSQNIGPRSSGHLREKLCVCQPKLQEEMQAPSPPEPPARRWLCTGGSQLGSLTTGDSLSLPGLATLPEASLTPGKQSTPSEKFLGARTAAQGEWGKSGMCCLLCQQPALQQQQTLNMDTEHARSSASNVGSTCFLSVQGRLVRSFLFSSSHQLIYFLGMKQLDVLKMPRCKILSTTLANTPIA